MTYSQPLGYRLSSEIKITAIARSLERFGWPVWQRATLRAVASVASELLAAPEERKTVYQTLSYGQIAEADLVISESQERGLLMRAAEFLDVGHEMMRRASALPLPRRLDLRCRAQFMDDQTDPYREWTYVLFGTEYRPLEELFLQIRGIEPFPLTDPNDPHAGLIDGPDWEMRGAVWSRVLAPYARYSPLSISAPDPHIASDIAASLEHSDRDPEYHARGRMTVTAVVAEVARQLGDEAPADLLEQLTAPIKRSV